MDCRPVDKWLSHPSQGGVSKANVFKGKHVLAKLELSEKKRGGRGGGVGLILHSSRKYPSLPPPPPPLPLQKGLEIPGGSGFSTAKT